MNFILILLLFAFSAVEASDRFSISCVRKFFKEKKITNVVVVDLTKSGHDKVLIDSFFRLTDTEYNWSVNVVSNISSVVNVRTIDIPKNVILFASTPADLGPLHATGHSANPPRIYIILTTPPLRDSVRSVFEKFGSSTQSCNVVVIGRASDSIWTFYRFVDDKCIANGSKSVITIAECNDSAIGAYIRHFSRKRPCPLVVATNQFEPFTYYDKVKGFHNGIDYLIVKTIAVNLRLNTNFIRIGNISVE